MLIRLEPSHFSESRGNVYGVRLAHRTVQPRLASLQRVFCDGIALPHIPGLDSHHDAGPGYDMVDETLWIAFPDQRNPRQVDHLDVIVAFEPTAEERPVTSRPVLMLGCQRSGTTALLMALDRATRLCAPFDVGGTYRSEGFYVSQVLLPWINQPQFACLGEHGALYPWPTSIACKSGFGPDILRRLAHHIDDVNTLSTVTPGDWIDKGPGFDAVVVAPLFLAAFPRGRVIFMSREPVSCCLSMLRLNAHLTSESGHGLDDLMLAAEVARIAAQWLVVHHVWHAYAKPLLPRHRYAEVRFEVLREASDELMDELATTLDLTDTERRDLPAVLRETKARSLPVDRAQLDPRIIPLLHHLVRHAAARWSYAVPSRDASVVLSEPFIHEAERVCRASMTTKLANVGVDRDIAAQTAAALVSGTSDDSLTFPPPRTGSLLRFLLGHEDYD